MKFQLKSQLIGEKDSFYLFKIKAGQIFTYFLYMS